MSTTCGSGFILNYFFFFIIVVFQHIKLCVGETNKTTKGTSADMLPNATKVMKDESEKPQTLRDAQQIAPPMLLVVDKSPLRTS